MGEFLLSTYARFEPAAPTGDLDDGISAPIADPAWFLGRQWQLGELQAADAGSPIVVHYTTKLSPFVDVDGADISEIPLETLVERTTDDWWTPARRLRVGADLLERAAGLDGLPDRLRTDCRAADLPPPYDSLQDRAVDGLRAYLDRARLGLPDEWFDELPAEASASADAGDGWDPARFEYNASYRAGRFEFDVERHDGGRVDWYSADARPIGSAPAPTLETGSVLATRLSYPGAPAPRWWQLERRQFDLGGFPPDRSHFATLLLLDVVSSHADNWFIAPIDTATPALGHLVEVEDLRVVDSFDETHAIESAPADWTLFTVEGLEGRLALPLVPTAVLPLRGGPLDEVDISIDEDANVVWANERRVAGRSTTDDRPLGDDHGLSRTNRPIAVGSRRCGTTRARPCGRTGIPTSSSRDRRCPT